MFAGHEAAIQIRMSAGRSSYVRYACSKPPRFALVQSRRGMKGMMGGMYPRPQALSSKKGEERAW